MAKTNNKTGGKQGDKPARRIPSPVEVESMKSTDAILTELAHHAPAQQNEIIRTVLIRTAKNRAAAYAETKKAFDLAQDNLQGFQAIKTDPVDSGISVTAKEEPAGPFGV